jgi:hypothetical protein
MGSFARSARHAWLVIPLLACGGSKSEIGIYNTPPSVSIVSPPDGSNYDEAETVTFEAMVSDDLDDDDSLGIRWGSDIEGDFEGTQTAVGGYATYVTANLRPGNHVVSIHVVDSQGEGASATVGVTIIDLPDDPEISIVHPIGGESAIEGRDFEFVAEVSDSFDEAETLLVTFSSAIDGDICTPIPDAIGIARCTTSLSEGDHLLTFTVVDNDLFDASATVYFPVISALEVDDDGDGYTENGGDCDDANPAIHPGAVEYYNTVDDDCNGIVDDGTEGYDDDGDGWTEIEGDCDDADDDTYPEAPELADGDDNDCDGTTDEGTVNYDDDGDGWTETDGDCDDGDPDVSPDAAEVCDGVDNDCDGDGDEEGADGCIWYHTDADTDFYGASGSTGSCLCAPEGTTTATNTGDCYDHNGDAKPGATSYHSTNRGDGSYDYDCDGSESKAYTSTFSCSCDWLSTCDGHTDGYDSVPGCGASATFKTGCSCWFWGCEESGSYSRTQACR